MQATTGGIGTIYLYLTMEYDKMGKKTIFWVEGYTAGRMEKLFGDFTPNPYSSGSYEADKWNEGFELALYK